MISIAIPTYNRADLLAETLESVLAQTYTDLEIVVSDNASTDNTAEVLAAFAARDRRIKTIRKPTNEGMIVNYNSAYAACTGDYIITLDSDDTFVPRALEWLLGELTAHPDIDLAGGRWYLMDELGRRLETVGPRPSGDLLKECVTGYPFWVSTLLMRRKVLDQFGLLYRDDVGTSGDWDLLIRVARAGHRFGCVQKPVLNHRIHGGNNTANIATLERSCNSVLARLYAEPNLPPEIIALKPEAQAVVQYTLLVRYANAGDWDASRRHLHQWLALYAAQPTPEVAARLAARLKGNVWDGRIAEPAMLIQGMRDHLAPLVPGLDAPLAAALVEAHWCQVLRRYAHDDAQAARHFAADAISRMPVMASNRQAFIDALATAGYHLTDSPEAYVKRGLANLPPSAVALANVQSEVLGALHVRLAFESYAMHDRKDVLCHVSSAVRHAPKVLRNRGVPSIFVRSLVGAR